MLPHIDPVNAEPQRGTNCWGAPERINATQRTLTSSDRCNKPVFYLVKGEGSRNIRSDRNGKIVGKLYEGDSFESNLISTHDGGKTYWAYGKTVSEDGDGVSIKGWLEVGNTKVVKQTHTYGSNDQWYKF